MFFGEPDIGKSTFLRKVGLEAMKGNNQGNRILFVAKNTEKKIKM